MIVKVICKIYGDPKCPKAMSTYESANYALRAVYGKYFGIVKRIDPDKVAESVPAVSADGVVQVMAPDTATPEDVMKIIEPLGLKLVPEAMAA